MTATPEEIEIALSRADMPINDGLGPSWGADAKALVTLAAAYRQLRDAQPRTWSAGDIGSAPEGYYYMDRTTRGDGWALLPMEKQSLIEMWPDRAGKAFGPIPQPPVVPSRTGRG